MPQPFHKLTVEEFAYLLENFPFSRKINAVHMHHTWRPNHAQDKGHDSVVAMWRYHTKTLGWSDIAQHVTIDKNGNIWTGRNWNQPPASASGHNGNSANGPFMFEMIGDFDKGKDSFEGIQREVALKVIALVQRRFKLAPEALFFHNQMSGKSCPGNAISYSEVLGAVKMMHADLQKAQPRQNENDFPSEPFRKEAFDVHEVLRTMVNNALLPASRSATLMQDPAEAELPEHNMPPEHIFQLSMENATGTTRSVGTRGGNLTPSMLSELRPHVVNLTEGLLSTGGTFRTSEGDVKAIFGEYLPKALKNAEAAGKPLHIIFYAHGGLVSEESALSTAYIHLNWWKGHPHIYPIYFIWETGLLETIKQMVDGGRRDLTGSRDLFTDKLIEELVRVGDLGPKIWTAMKQSAAVASSSDGGARFVAHELAAFLNKFQASNAPDKVRLHGVGHSAGAIFHRHFIPKAMELGAPAFTSLHYLAPAIRVDEFNRYVAPLVGNDIGHLSMFTMRQDLERADTCIEIYRKSLLYLIYNALEREEDTPILGLEESLRNNSSAANLFGLGGASSGHAEVIFSTSVPSRGRSATRAIKHGDFDNDAATMESVLRRILDLEDNDQVKPFPESAFRGFKEGQFTESDNSKSGNDVSGPSQDHGGTADDSTTSNSKSGNGKKRALCVGINTYPMQPLSGCVADAKLWASALKELGFETEMLLDGEATRENLLARLKELVTKSQPGDVIVFQFAGHGTFFIDKDGDELDRTDEALCPVDLHTGAIILDDEIHELFAKLPIGVNLTCFIDSCHSGSISRFAMRSGMRGRTRFILPTTQMQNFYLNIKAKAGKSRKASPQPANRDVTFSACLPNEPAWETDGQGDFTLRGVGVLRELGNKLTNQAFFEEVTKRFGPSRRQTPFFEPIAEVRNLPLLAPIGKTPTNQPQPEHRKNDPVLGEILQLLRQINDKLSK